LATRATTPATASDRLKWAFFAFVALSLLLVGWVDERFWLNPADPHWKHIAPVKTLLPIHGLAGLTALVAGGLQMSGRIRRQHVALHRTLGKVYIAAVCVSAPIALYIGTGGLEPGTMHVEQVFQAGLWLLCALVAWACIRSGQMALHKAWMIRSYAFTLVFVLSRVPDAWIASYTDQGIADFLWSLIVAALIAPDVITTAQTLFRIRSAKARSARVRTEALVTD
jgi:uncharacterized membrane protein